MNAPIKARTWYRGLRNGKEVVGWDLRRDKVHSLLRRMMPKNRMAGCPEFTIEARMFFEKQEVAHA